MTRELPILFSGPMVRAILDGHKTQTRRVITRVRGYKSLTEFRPSDTHGYDWHFRRPDGCWCDYRHDDLLKLLPFQVGDRLYVRESWRTFQRCDALKASDLLPGMVISFEADHEDQPNDGCRGKLRPGIFLPKWASRIWLEVTDVRVERLDEISEEDATAEGWPHQGHKTTGLPTVEAYPIAWFGHLWDSLNAKRGLGWKANPWVAAYTFKRIEKPG